MKRILPFLFLLVIPLNGHSQTWSNVGSGFFGCLPSGFYSSENLWIGGGWGSCAFSGMTVPGVCILDGNVIDTLASPLNGEMLDARWYNGRFIAGGNFSYAGPPPFGVPFTGRIASWDTITESWSSLTPAGGLNSNVECMEVYNSDLYIGGQMTVVNGVACNRIAKWNGSVWSNVSSGVHGSIESIYSMTIYHGQLYVGGLFTSVGTGNIPAYYIARWNGSQWDSVGGGLNGGVYAMVVDSINDVLYVGGGFTYAGGVPANGVAMWNDTQWSAVGNGTDTLWGTKCLAVFNGELFAGGGNITVTSQGDTINNVYKFNGTKWISVDGGANNTVLIMDVYDGNLYIGGGFSQVGTGTPATYIACYGTTCPTSVGIDEQPPPVPFEMYPNPTDDVLHITTQDPGELIFRLYNSAGQLVREQKFRNLLDYSTKELAAGTYTIQVSVEDGSRSHSEALIVK